MGKFQKDMINICILNNKEPELINLLHSLFGLFSTQNNYKVHLLCDGTPSDYIEYLNILTKDLNFDINVYYNKLNKKDGGFSKQRQYIHDKIPDNEWILFLDSDEWVDQRFFLHIQNIISQNPVLDSIYFCRENKIYGYDRNWLLEHNLSIDTQERINYPEYLMRLYKKKPGMYWRSDVHEALIGTETSGRIEMPDNVHPDDRFIYMIKHYKTFAKQVAQDSFYSDMRRSF